MGKMLLIVIFGMSVIFALTFASILQRNTMVLDGIIMNYYNSQSKLLAESGVEMSLRILRENSNLAANEQYTQVVNINKPEINGVNIQIKIEPTTVADERKVSSVCYIPGMPPKGVICIVKITDLSSRNSDSPDLTSYISKAVAVQGNFSMKGTASVLSENPSIWHADVHTNGSAALKGTPSIQGTLSSAGKITESGNPDGIFEEYQPAINIPRIKFDTIVTKLRNNPGYDFYEVNNLNNNNLVLGTKDKPAVYYVKGDFKVSGNITGYGTILVESNASISGGFTLTSSSSVGNTVGLFFEKQLTLTGHAQINGTVYCGTLNAAGTADIFGNLIISDGGVDLNGTLGIHYVPSLLGGSGSVTENSNLSGTVKVEIKKGSFQDVYDIYY